MRHGCAALHRAVGGRAPEMAGGEMALRVSASQRQGGRRRSSARGLNPVREATAKLLVAVPQILIRNRKNRIRLDFDVPHEASPCAGIADLGIITSWFDACDAQPLVVVDLLVPVVQ